MPLDTRRTLSQGPKWILLPAPHDGVEILVKHASPRQAEIFGQRMVRKGVMQMVDGRRMIAPGMVDEFYRHFADQYVVDWRPQEGKPEAIQPVGAPYDHIVMGRELSESRTTFEFVSNEIAEDADFFGPSNGGSKAS